MNNEKSLSILVVDDQKDFLETISYWLTKGGCFVTTAETGKEALERVDQQDFDVIFLDIVMQPMDGFEVLGKIKEKKPTAKVIMLTADNKPIREGKSEAMGADGYYYKGSDYSDVIATIKKVLAED